MADSKPIEPISEALRIIEDATKSSNFLMNKHQCESLARRLASVIGETLKGLQKECVCNEMDYPAFDMLLTALKKATALLSKYTETKESIPSVLTRTEDREAFKEIHAELDMLNSQFPFDEFQYTSESMLTENADEDKQELPGILGQTATVTPSNLEKMKVVVSEKTEGRAIDDDLPSYLKINPADVEIKAPVRMPEWLSERDRVETYGWALVRFGAYLGCEFAIKVFNSGDTTWNRSELLKEVRSLMQLHHPHVVQLMGFAQDAEKCIILMELLDTDLRHFMKSRCRDGKRPFGPSEEMDIITQIARGLLYLHEQGYVHGELKCSNILVKKIGDHIDVKISDLRSSQKLGVWDPVLFKERSFRRRARWTAPEAKRYGASLEPTHELLKKTDVYSFGMVCFEVVTGKLPFQDVRGEVLERRIATGELLQELPADMDPKLRALIESCWARDPHDRPTLEEVCHLLDDIRSSQPGFFAPVWRRLKWILAISQKPRAPLQDGGDERPLTLPDFVRIEPEKLTKELLLGRGASAEVHLVTWLRCKYALKTFSSTSPPNEVEAELKFLVELRHPCVVRLIGLSVDQSERRCSIVMEFMGSDLRKLINTRMGSNRTVPFDLHEAVYIITRIALGMAFLHARGVVHRDLKALNVLIPDHPGSIDVKISDFGMSQLIDPKGKLPLGHVGTRFWRAPELLVSPPKGEEVHQPMEVDGEPLRSHDPLKAADVYSFAMTSYEVLTGGVPLDEEVMRFGPAAVKQKVIAGELRPRLPVDLNPALKELIEECWTGEPEKRPTFFTICEKLRQIQLGLGCLETSHEP